MSKSLECRGEALADNRLIPMRDTNHVLLISLYATLLSVLPTLPRGRGSGDGDTKSKIIRYWIIASWLQSQNLCIVVMMRNTYLVSLSHQLQSLTTGQTVNNAVSLTNAGAYAALHPAYTFFTQRKYTKKRRDNPFDWVFPAPFPERPLRWANKLINSHSL